MEIKMEDGNGNGNDIAEDLEQQREGPAGAGAGGTRKTTNEQHCEKIEKMKEDN